MRSSVFLSLTFLTLAASASRADNNDYNIGTQLLNQGKFADAVPYFDKALQNDPGRIDALHNRSVCYARLGKYKEAVADADRALRLKPDFAYPYELKALVHELQYQWDPAIPLLTKAIELAPQSATPYGHRGHCYLEKKDADKAIADLTLAVKYAPRDTDYYCDLGAAWAMKKDYAKAVETYTQARAADPHCARAVAERGACLVRMGKTEEGKKQVEEAIRMEPGQKGPFTTTLWTAFSERGSLALIAQDYDRAIKDFDEAVRVNPQHGWGLYNRAVALMLARRAGAADGFRAVMDLQGWTGDLSFYAVVLGNLAARRAGDEQAAQKFLKDAVGKSNGSWPYPVVKYLRGEIDEAAVLKAATDDGKRTEARCYLGLDLALKGRREQAVAHLRWLQEHADKAYSEYAIAQAELKRLENLEPPPKR